MKRRSVIVILLLCAMAAIVLAFVWPGEREPVYEGKTLSQWLCLQHRSIFAERKQPGWDESKAALRRLGARSFPFLLDWLNYERPQWKTKLLAFMKQHTPKLRASIVGDLLEKDWNTRRADAAGYGFALLGAEASPVAPALERMAADRTRPATANRAAIALRDIGNGARFKADVAGKSGEPK